MMSRKSGEGDEALGRQGGSGLLLQVTVETMHSLKDSQRALEDGFLSSETSLPNVFDIVD
jgi:ribosomal protein S28E/S33